MQNKLVQPSFLLFILLSIFSCGQRHNKNNETSNSIHSLNAKPDTITAITNDSIPLKRLNYERWETFWVAFTKATERKDTVTIVELTHFPFLQNTFLTTQSEFLELWISQVYDLNSADTPVLADEIILHINESEKSKFAKLDSVYYTNKHGKDFYFARVNGYYRLLEIITPG